MAAVSSTTTSDINTSPSEQTKPIQGTIEATLTYLSPTHNRNERLWYKRPPPPNITRPPPNESTNYMSSMHTVTIHDVRNSESPSSSSYESTYSLETHGFSFGKLTGIATDEKLLNDIREDMEGDFIRNFYYPGMEEALKKKTGADRVVVFDHLVRKKPEAGVTMVGLEKVVNGPVQVVHIDQTKEYAHGFLQRTLKDHASDMITKRAQIINVWRPLIDTVEDFPLTVLDNRTLDEASQLVPSKAIYENSNLDREIYHVMHHPDHRWHFLSKQKKDECIFIKCFDTQESGTAHCAPHTSFENSNAEPGAPARESIEIRAWVLYAGDDEKEQVDIKTVPEWEKPELRWTTRWPQARM